MWSYAGLLCALGTGAVAWLRSRTANGTFYERDVYGMTPRSHRRYAYASAIFALYFIASAFRPSLPAVPALAVFAVVAILYASSFVRGATGEDE
ncbi:MAG: hypothetical protein ACYDG0_10180 [Vulcanimicrobiaceae bacterium]